MDKKSDITRHVVITLSIITLLSGLLLGLFKTILNIPWACRPIEVLLVLSFVFTVVMLYITAKLNEKDDSIFFSYSDYLKNHYSDHSSMTACVTIEDKNDIPIWDAVITKDQEVESHFYIKLKKDGRRVRYGDLKLYQRIKSKPEKETEASKSHPNLCVRINGAWLALEDVSGFDSDWLIYDRKWGTSHNLDDAQIKSFGFGVKRDKKDGIFHTGEISKGEYEKIKRFYGEMNAIFKPAYPNGVAVCAKGKWLYAFIDCGTGINDDPAKVIETMEKAINIK